MKNTKRILELVAAIISIVLGAILALGCFILLGSKDALKESLMAEGLKGDQLTLAMNYMNVVLIILLLVSVAIVILGAILCKAPQVLPNGIVKERKGVANALSIILCVLGGFEISGDILIAIIILVPAILLIVSSKMQNSYSIANYQPTYNGNNGNPTFNQNGQAGGQHMFTNPTVGTEGNNTGTSAESNVEKPAENKIDKEVE